MFAFISIKSIISTTTAPMVLSLSNAIRLFQSDNIDFDWNPKVDGFASTSCQMFDIRFPFFLKNMESVFTTI